MKSQRCHYCDRKAEYLCDFLLAVAVRWDEDFERRLREKDPTLTTDDLLAAVLSPVDVRTRTCDRPLCEKHRHNRGHTFYCGADGGIVTQDFCPGHACGPDRKPRYNPIGGPKAG